VLIGFYFLANSLFFFTKCSFKDRLLKVSQTDYITDIVVEIDNKLVVGFIDTRIIRYQSC